MTTPARHYQHPEAFCLMLYRSDDGTEEEIIWNSRDGVTPFTITSRTGKPMTHVDWNRDTRRPDLVPAPGTRVFVDMTPARARTYAEARVEAWSEQMDEHPFFADFTRAQRIAFFAEEMTRQPGAPALVTVVDWPVVR